jgi:eukaryotic-like serine/threonine-protein kinase
MGATIQIGGMGTGGSASGPPGPNTEPRLSQLSDGNLVGQCIAGKYDLVRLIGQGGMGAVYEARHRETLKRCAVKLLLSAEFAKSDEMLKRFYREARACAVVESEHIVQVFDSGTDPANGYPYMVMELLQGEDLEHVHERLGALQPEVVAKLMMQATHGLGKAHEAGIVHRDIKLANLFLSTRDTGGLTVKLLDFGIAKVKMENFAATSSAGGHGLTRTGSMLGTPLYMSPEQAKGAAQVDARSDVWSLGVVMYNLLSGRLPYGDANSLGELLVMIITGDIPLLQDFAPWVPPELAEIVHLAMSRDLTKRYANAMEIRNALSPLVGGNPMVALDQLQPVPPELRTQVMPKLALTDGVLRASGTRTGMAITAGAPPLTKKSSAGLAITVSLASLAVLAGGGFLAWRMTRAPQAVAPTQVLAESANVVAAAPPAASVDTRAYMLQVGPEGVEAFVDGVRQEVKQGAVEVKGPAGSTRGVKLSFKGTDLEQVVAITQTGLIPSKLEVASKTAVVPGKTGGKSSKSSKDDTSTTTKTPAKKPPGVTTDTSEF